MGEIPRGPIHFCPVCDRGLDAHHYSDIASVEVGADTETTLAKMLDKRDWSAAAEYQRANALQDIRVWRAVRCSTGRVSIFPVILAFDVWTEDKAEAPIVLDSLESAQLNHFVGNRWKPL
jgi:hypothetical protein